MGKTNKLNNDKINNSYNINKNYNNRNELIFNQSTIINKDNLNFIIDNFEYVINKFNPQYNSVTRTNVFNKLKQIKKDTDINKLTKYIRPKKRNGLYNYGRYYADQSIMSVNSNLRNLVINNKDVVDIDINNCHWAILLNIIPDNIEIPNIRFYCDNRDECFLLMKNTFNIDRKKSKELLLTILNNGTINKKYHELDFIKNMSNELALIHDYIKSTDLGKEALDYSMKKEHVYENNGILYKGNNQVYNMNGSVLNLILIKTEADIINEVINFLDKINKEIYIYSYDGLLINNSNVDDSFLSNIELHIKTTLNLNIQFSFKPLSNLMSEELITEVNDYNKTKNDINYNDSNLTVYKDVEFLSNLDLDDSINIFHDIAGSGKTTKCLDYILNDNTKKTSLIISPLIINQRANIKTFIDLNNNKYELNFIKTTDDIDKLINNSEYNEDTINIIVQGDNHLTFKNLIEYVHKNMPHDHVQYGNYFNINRLVIFSVINSVKWVTLYLQQYENSNIDLLFIDELYETFNNLNQIAITHNLLDKSPINKIDLKEFVIRLIEITPIVFLSDILIRKSLLKLAPNRKYNLINFKKGDKFISYDKIHITNNEDLYNNIVKQSIDKTGIFCWCDTKAKSNSIYFDFINKNELTNNIVNINANTIFDESFLKIKNIISSPKISSCININVDEYDIFKERQTIGFLSGQSNISIYSFINSLQRNRRVKCLNIFIEKEEHIIKPIKNNRYTPTSHALINNLINDYNEINLLTMIESLNKNEHFELINDFDPLKKNIKINDVKIESKYINLIESSYIIKNRIIYNQQDVTELNENDKINIELIDDNIKTDNEIINKCIELFNTNLTIRDEQLLIITEYNNVLKDFSLNSVINDEILTRDEVQDKYNTEFKFEIDYITNYNKTTASYSMISDFRKIKIINKFNKNLMIIKNILDKNKIFYNNYKFEDTNTYNIFVKDKILINNTKAHTKILNITKKIDLYYKKLDEHQKYIFLANISNKNFKNNEEFQDLLKTLRYKVDDNNIIVKTLNTLQLYNGGEVINNYNFVDFNEIVNNINNDKLNKLYNNRRYKNKISRDILDEITKHKQIDYNTIINFDKLADTRNRITLLNNDVNKYTFKLNELNLNIVDLTTINKEVYYY